MDVRVNDIVYVLGFGDGIVNNVRPDGSFDVRTGPMLHSFSSEGTSAGSRVQKVYYQNPIIISPTKNKTLWRTYVRLTQALYQEIMSLDNQKVLPEVKDE